MSNEAPMRGLAFAPSSAAMRRNGTRFPMAAQLAKALIVLTPLAAYAQWLNVDLPPIDRDEMNAERMRQPDSDGASIGSDWDWTTMTQADLMQHALPVLAANVDMCGEKVIRYRGEKVCDFFPFYLSNESHPNAYTDGVDFIYITAGMVRSLRSADEYRAVIGHEIGHIISGHVVKVQRRRNRGALVGAVVGLGLAAAAANEGVAVPPSIVTSAAHIGALFGTLRFSEQHELEADYIGAYMLARSGGDIDTAKKMWRRWGVGDGARGSWLSYHPTDVERFALLSAVAREVGRKADEGLEVRPNVRESPKPKNMQYFSATLDRYDTNGNGTISCREAQQQGIAPIPVDHPAWHYAQKNRGPPPKMNRIGRVVEQPDRPVRPRC